MSSFWKICSKENWINCKYFCQLHTSGNQAPPKWQLLKNFCDGEDSKNKYDNILILYQNLYYALHYYFCIVKKYTLHFLHDFSGKKFVLGLGTYT